MLDRTAKESIKTGLAITVTYAVALAMNWDKPMWAAFVVAFCSLATIGHSFAKLLERLLGTVVACAAALLILALSIQDRWLFMVALSVWTGLCTYLAAGLRFPYAWQVAGISCAVIAIDASGDPTRAFTIAVLRTQETSLGILIYGLFALFLWPSSSRASFRAVARERAATQRQLFQAGVSLLRSGEGHDELKRLRTQLLVQERQFDDLLGAARLDSPEVADRIALWQRYRHEASALTEHLMRWQEGFAELQSLDLARLLPGLQDLEAEIERCLAAVEQMLDDRPPGTGPESVALSINPAAVWELRQFDTAALAVGKARMERIRSTAHALFGVVALLKGFDASAPADVPEAPAPETHAAPSFVPDPDRLAAVLRVLVGLWTAFLLVVYVGDVPGGLSLVLFAGALGIPMALAPQVPIRVLFKPAAWSLLFAGALYMFVMPKLSSFLGLGLLIFAVTTGIGYLFSSPRQVLGRALGIALFLAIASIDNEQRYSFLVVANTGMMFALTLTLLTFTAHVPYSPDPRRAFVRLVRRYFRSCASLTTALSGGPRRRGLLERWRRAHHLREMTTLPAKLAAWGNFIDASAPPGDTAARVAAVVTGLQSVTARMRELLEVSAVAQAPLLAREFEAEVTAWRGALEQLFGQLSEDPGAAESRALARSLDGFLERLEARIKDVVETVDSRELQPGDGECFYRLLGAFRSVSEALVRYADAAPGIEWSRWREERFV